jgi:alpha-L-arabinofuranosidase
MTGFRFETAWGKNGGYPYDDIRNGLQEANVLGADQMHVVNYGTGTPEEAGRYVSYLNRSGDANRVRYPFAQQNVRLFEIGNEIAWSMVRGHKEYAPNESVYAQRAKLFAQQMRANSDVPIQIGAVASINSNWLGNGWSGGATTVKNILQIMGDQVDFLIYHGYPSWPLHRSGDLNTVMAQNEWNRQKMVNEIIPAIRQFGGGRNIRIANTEFFTHMYNDAPRSRGLFGALYAADTVNLSFNLDLLTSVEFCFDHKELADAAFFFNNDPNNTTAIFKFQKMLAEHWGDQIVATSGNQIPALSVAGSATTVNLPKLAYSAATSGNKVYLMVVHRMNDADIPAQVSVGFSPSRITSYTLTDPQGWSATNAMVTTRQVNSLQSYTFPKASVTILEIER